MKIQQKVQLILPVLLRTIGPILLRSGIGGAGGAGGTSTSTSNDDDDSDDDTSGDSKTRTGSNGRKVSISLPTFPPDQDDDDDEDTAATTKAATKATTTTTTTAPTTVPTQAPTTTATADSTETAALVGRVDIRIDDANVGNASESDKDTNADAIAALFTETPTTTEKVDIIPLSGDSQVNIDINQSSSGSLSSSDGKPTATYLPTSNDSNLVRRKKAIQN